MPVPLEKKSEKLLLAKLANFYSLSPKNISELVRGLNSFEQLDDLSERQLATWLTKSKAKALHQYWHQLSLDQFAKILSKHQIWYLTITDDNFPELLKHSRYSVYLLFGRGDPQILNQPYLAVVGSRKPSAYGAQVATHFGRSLAASGIGVISGLALGVDEKVHAATVEMGGRAVAIVGHGLDQIHPRSNQNLAQKIIATGGAILSEYGLGTPPLRQHFPARNRLIAAMAHACVVVEGNRQSGSLITAHYAFKLERKVGAVPGQITTMLAEGPNWLIKSGASILTCADDLIELLPGSSLIKANPKTHLPSGLTAQQLQLLDLIEQEPVTVDELAAKLGSDIINLNRYLTVLEIHSLIEVRSGKIYRC